ncbi:unnamed protein product [Chironomus riparius]|uniref:Uncharacterized protein n=1 Tax=Chironomus riparius TaxID=315576 RepID=A0A9N9S066_9DIPT|nr:unnamed protein product [Chironomus riparius]
MTRNIAKFCWTVVFILFAVLDNVKSEENIKLNPKTKFFEVILDRVEVLYEDPKFFETHLRVKKVNKTRTLVGYADIRQAIGNDCDAELKTLKKQGGEYRYSPYKVSAIPLCEGLASDTYVYPEFAANSDFPLDIANNCPIPAGNYSMRGISFTLENVPTNVAQTGEYGCELIFSKNNETIAMYRIYGYVNFV